MDESFKKDIMPYMLLKYPEPKNKGCNLKFASAIKEVDSLDNVENDLIYRSGIKFTYEKDGDYSSQIM